MKIKYILSVFSVFSLAGAYVLPAAAIPSFVNNSIEVSSPVGTKNSSGDGTFSSGSFTDDIFLDKIQFSQGGSTTTFSGNSNFQAVQRIEVIEGRDGDGNSGEDRGANVNGEFGAEDDGADGDDTPLVKGGFDTTVPTVQIQESTNPSIQDPLLLEALNSRNLIEIADGEGDGQYTLRIIFEQGVVDNDPNNDSSPEIILFERNGNDPNIEFDLITGGTFDNPKFGGNTVAEASNGSNFSKTDISIKTKEINSAQDLFVIGLDFSEDFGLATDTTVFGVDITSTDGGADIGGVFLTSDTPANFEDVPPDLTAVPFEVEGSMGAVLLGAFLWYRHRKRQSNHAYNQESE